MRLSKGQAVVIFSTLVLCVVALFGFSGREDKGHTSLNSTASSQAPFISDEEPLTTSGAVGPSPPGDGPSSTSIGPSVNPVASSPGTTIPVPVETTVSSTPAIIAADGTQLVSPEGTVPPAPVDTIPADNPTMTNAIRLPTPYEQAETFVREYWTITVGESEEAWKQRVGQYGTSHVHTLLSPYPFNTSYNSEVDITDLTEVNGTVGNNWAEFNIVANVSKLENGERVKTLPLPMYVFVRLENEGWIVSGFSFFTT